jgi:hypothetical protein
MKDTIIRNTNREHNDIVFHMFFSILYKRHFFKEYGEMKADGGRMKRGMWVLKIMV